MQQCLKKHPSSHFLLRDRALVPIGAMGLRIEVWEEADGSTGYWARASLSLCHPSDEWSRAHARNQSRGHLDADPLKGLSVVFSPRSVAEDGATFDAVVNTLNRSLVFEERGVHMDLARETFVKQVEFLLKRAIEDDDVRPWEEVRSEMGLGSRGCP